MINEADFSAAVSAVGEQRFAVYLSGNHSIIRDGWMYLYTGLWGAKVTSLAYPKRLLTHTEAIEWKQAMYAYDQRITATICELVPV